MPDEKALSFYLDGVTYNPDTLETFVYEGSYANSDHYSKKVLEKEAFFLKMVEAAREDGRREVRDSIKSTLGLPV